MDRRELGTAVRAAERAHILGRRSAERSLGNN